MASRRRRAVQVTVDIALQLYSANDIGKDRPLVDFYENGRRLRIVDGTYERADYVRCRRFVAAAGRRRSRDGYSALFVTLCRD